jgi:rRNA processing protein Krr1/Pno1
VGNFHPGKTSTLSRSGHPRSFPRYTLDCQRGVDLPARQETTTEDEIQLISDGDGLAVIGEATAVERFLVAEGLPSKDLGLQRLRSVLSAGAGVAQAGSAVAAGSGRWVKLTAESAQKVKKYGLMQSKTRGVSHAMVGQPGSITSWLQIETGALLTNPAMLAGAAGIMAQMAMQQTMDEITDYLARIDEKVDDVLRAQKDAVLARMIGVGFVIQESMTLREKRGRVDEVTWSKVQAAPATIAETQAYTLRQLDALAEKLERKTKIGDLAEAAKDAESKVREWLAVLARCFQLQDAIAVLELDRVLDASPDELDGHRLGLKDARKDRLELISRCTEQLMARMDAAAGTANSKVLLHPTTSPVVVQSSEHVALAVADFHERLGIESGRASLEARRWVDAATEFRDKALETGADGIDGARRLSNETLDRAKSATGRLSSRITERALRRRGDDEERNEDG